MILEITTEKDSSQVYTMKDFQYVGPLVPTVLKFSSRDKKHEATYYKVYYTHAGVRNHWACFDRAQLEQLREITIKGMQGLLPGPKVVCYLSSFVGRYDQEKKKAQEIGAA